MKSIYGFVRAPGRTDFGPIGVGGAGETVYALQRGGLAAVVGETDDAEIGLLPKEEVVRRLGQHQFVVESVMRAGCTILPMKLGTVLESEPQVAELLETNHETLQGLLRSVEGLFEMQVVAVWPDMRRVLVEIGAAEDAVELKPCTAELSYCESLAERLSLGRLVRDRLDARRRALQGRTMLGWDLVAHKAVHHKIRNDPVVIYSAFLLDPGGREALETLVAKAGREQGGALQFRLVGPLPPYSFSTVRLARAQGAEFLLIEPIEAS